jgi:hypothetical protein
MQDQNKVLLRQRVDKQFERENSFVGKFCLEPTANPKKIQPDAWAPSLFLNMIPIVIFNLLLCGLYWHFAEISS